MEKEKSKQLLKNSEIYGNVKKTQEENEAYAQWAMNENEAINKGLEAREQASIVFNGIPYSLAYVYNQKKAINYAPPKSDDDSEVSYGIIHEKIIAFTAIYLKMVYKRNTKVYDENGNVIEGLGKVYDLAIEHSYKLEQFKKLIALIYWEVFTQGNAFVLEDWQVKTCKDVEVMKDGKVLNPENMDYSYEFLDGLTYNEKEEGYQTRKAVSVLLDGRQVIFANPEVVEAQDQEWIAIEEEIDMIDAEKLYGTLKRWKDVPKTREEVNEIISDKATLFDANRLANPDKKVIVQRKYSKAHNRFNFSINGVWMLDKDTPMSIFYPRMNYPLTNVPAERLTGSIYCRSIPAKTKFNADFVDWALKGLAYKFEQGKTPAILTSGRYTLTKEMFRGGQITHGVKKTDYEFADPENKGITNNDVSFVNLMKGIVENQTTGILGAGDLSKNPTAEEIATLDQNQKEKLGYLLDGLVNGFTDMYQRRAETIESKYTIKQKETVVDGKIINVYQNFTVSVAGTDHVVTFDDNLDNPDFNETESNNALFEKSFNEKKKGKDVEYYLVNPRLLKEGKTFVDCEVTAEKRKDAAIEMISMWTEFGNLLKVFNGQVNMEDLKKEYLQVSNRSETIFLNKSQMEQLQNQAPQDPTQQQIPQEEVKNQMLGR